MNNTVSASASFTWPKAALIAGIVLLAIFALYWPTFRSMAEIWERSETFTHGFLIFPISAWLIWGRRHQLVRLIPKPDWLGLIMLGLAGVAWLLADAGSVNVAAQYAFIALLIAAVWAVLGLQVVWALFFPLMFLFFAVPVGEFLIPPLMNFTADFTVAALQMTGIPVYREGTFFSIPSGDWSVVEGCSGLRYLIASVTLGCLYAYLTYRSFKRRLIFTLASLVVPVLANGFRAYMIVMIAHLSDMKLALGVDHYIYGWVWFGIVMLALFWVGSYWRQDGAEEGGVEAGLPAQTGREAASVIPSAVSALLVALAWPAYATWLSNRDLPYMPEMHVEARQGWQPANTFTDWKPHWLGADRQFRQSYARSGQNIFLELNYYATQRQEAEIINSQNFMIEQKHPVWSNVGEGIVSVDIDGTPRQVRQAKLRSASGQRLLVWQWNLINRHPTVNDHYAKLVLAFDRVRNRRDDGLSVLIATPYDADISAAAGTLARFAVEMQPSIESALNHLEGR